VVRPTSIRPDQALPQAQSVDATYAGEDADWTSSASTAAIAVREDDGTYVNIAGVHTIELDSATLGATDNGDGSVTITATAGVLPEDIDPLVPVAIVAVFDGGGTEIADNAQLDLRIPFDCTITAWTLLADQSGAVVIDVWRDTLANYPPTDADALPGSGKEPTIAASATNATDTTITDWVSDDIVAGDCLRFNVDSCTSITQNLCIP
jgi:hypothetical protein